MKETVNPKLLKSIEALEAQLAAMTKERDALWVLNETGSTELSEAFAKITEIRKERDAARAEIKACHELLDTNGVGLIGEPLPARISDVVAEWKSSSCHEDEVRADERAFWIKKFNNWLKCYKDGSAHDAIKSEGFRDCILALTINDRWMQADSRQEQKP